ncbi:TetR family transcriptional regulator [Rhodococcus sp. AG1013]|uniref:TetR/AcrR family transcriptional regulator n=1 Tax=Rhodococcus sp. AG1013 TaxID=2183996 RepID=UPI000E0AB425|nr:TetR family transcriptional regulator C-terminal domain-containing protein [Rhodococcus sp. AG1013]RDI17246.1 TetR family transcriptional regulator [Rhodococcus sp. AG1013]
MTAVAPREERKARLAEAVWRIIAERGITAVSVRTVATEAGMAVGSLRNLFSTQAELLEFSAELMVARAAARVTAIPPSADTVAYALAAIRELMPLTPQTRREFEINVALIAETPAHPGLAQIRDHAHRQLLDLFTRIAAMLRDEAASSSASRTDGRRLLALADGLGMHLLHQRAGDDTDWALDIIRGELHRIDNEPG